MNKRQIIIVLLLLIAMGLTAKISEGEIASNFKSKTFEGSEIELHTFLKENDGLVLLDFWATWCAPCVEALPHLNELGKKHNIKVIAICEDGRRTLNKAKKYIEEKKFDFVNIIDEKNHIQTLFEVQAIPATFIIDAEGKILYTHTGYKKGDEVELDKHLTELLKKD